MANHSSAKKAIRQTLKKTLINKDRSSKIKTCVKKLLQELSNGSVENARKTFTVAQSEIMKGVAKKVLKLNTASRKISRLAQKVKSLEG